MPRHLTIVLFAIVVVSQAAMAQTFQKVSGSQIRSRLAGMEMTDGVHWADVFEANGTLNSFSMSKKTTGTWRFRKTSYASIAERMMAAATKCGWPERKSSCAVKALSCPWKVFCKRQQPAND